MRNLKKVLCLALVLAMVLAVVSGAAYYRDYKDAADMTMLNENYQLAAQYFNELGIIVGVPTADEGVYEYQPNELLTRAELARILYVLYSGIGVNSTLNPGTAYESLPCTFTDIGETWAVKEIKYGYTMGYLNGRNATTYAPNDNVTAQELATALLVAIGYDKAELAKSWPKNVIINGYSNDAKTNLFTTGLPNSAADVTAMGEQIAGITTGTTGNMDYEAELELSAALTRQQAIFMMYKAVENRNMFGKTYSLMKKVWGAEVSITSGSGYVYATQNASYYGDTTGGLGLVMIEDAQTATSTKTLYKDLGTSYTANAPYGDTLGFFVDYENWDANLGKKLSFNVINFLVNGTPVNAQPYINGYDINFENLSVNGVSGRTATVSTVEVAMNTPVSIDGAKVVIGEDKYTLFRGGATVSVNGTKTTIDNIADFAAEIGNGAAVGADGMTADKLTLTVVDGQIAIANELEYAVYTVADIYDNATILGWGYPGFKDVKLTDGQAFCYGGIGGPNYTVSGSLKVGATILGYIHANGSLKGSVVEATEIKDASVVISGGKYYINEEKAENEIKFAYSRAAGDDSNEALVAPAKYSDFTAGSGKTYDFTLIDGLVYACVECTK